MKIKRELKRILKERQKNLLRLLFDKLFAESIYPKDKEEEYREMTERINEVRNKLTELKSVSNKVRDRGEILKLERELNGDPGTMGLVEKAKEMKKMFDNSEIEIKRNIFRLETEVKLIHFARKMLKRSEGFIEKVKEYEEKARGQKQRRVSKKSDTKSTEKGVKE